MKNKIDLSIVIPVYKTNIGCFQRCLSSIFNQVVDHLSYEVIVVLDGENENKEILDCGLLNRHPNVRSIILPHGGVARARNRGIGECRGEWLIFVDADDYLPLGAVQQLMDGRNDECDLVVANHSRVYGRRVIPIRYFNRKKMWGKQESSNFVKDVLSVGSDQGTVWGKLFRLSFLRNNHILFNENLVNGEDQVFVLEVVLRDPIIRAIPNNVYMYTYNSSSSVRNFDALYVSKLMHTLVEIERMLKPQEISYRHIYNIFLLDRLLLIIVNYIFNPNSSYTLSHKHEIFLKIISDPFFSRALEERYNNSISLSRRITLSCVKKKRFYLVLLIVRIRNIRLSISNRG